jgi:uncharacterized protein (TIGR02147 family)
LLSLFLSGKRTLSENLASRIADRLGCSPDHRSRFILSAQSKTEVRVKGATRTLDAPETETPFRQLTLDQFNFVSEWYFFAILSALELPGSKLEARWLSSQLGISLMEAKLAIEVLKRLELVKKTPEGQWKQSGAPLRIDNTISTAATRNFHQKLLSKAQTALDTLPFEKRDFSSVTFVMDPEQIPYAKKRIQEFRRSLMNELESRSPEPRAVYQVSIQLFPLTPESTSQNTDKSPKEGL